MNDNENLFENLVRQFSIKFGRLQIAGYHGKPQNTLNMSIGRNESIRKSEQITSKVHIKAKITNHTYGTEQKFSLPSK